MEIFDRFEIALPEIRYERPLGLISTGESKELPYYFHISTDTDLGVLVPSAAGVFVTLVVGVVTVVFQRRQIRANITGFRHHWMVELRRCASEYLQFIYSTAWNLTEKEDFAQSAEYLSAQDKIALLTFNIELLLSRDDDSTKAIFELDRTLCDKLYSLTYKSPLWVEFINDLYKLRDLFRIELEDAWIDVQVDLSAKKRKAVKGEIFARLASLLSKTAK